MKYTQRINLKLTPKDKQQVVNDAANLGFFSGKGCPNLSRYIRWVLRHGNKPIDREHYKELILLNLNLIKSETLFNQYLYHLNRERKMLLEKGIEDNNKQFLANLDNQKEEVAEIKSMLQSMQKIMHKIYILENA